MLSAKYLDDKRVRKMVLESAQLMSTALVYHYNDSARLLFETNKLPRKRKKRLRDKYASNLGVYKPSYFNHPCSVWCRETLANFEWLLEHFFWLHEEYVKRFGKTHASYDHCFDAFIKHKGLIPEGKRTPFVNCAANEKLNISFKHIDDVHLAYRSYLNVRFLNDKITPVSSIGVFDEVKEG